TRCLKEEFLPTLIRRLLVCLWIWAIPCSIEWLMDSLKIGSVGASRVAAEEAYSALDKGRVSKHDLEQTLKKMGKEGLQWGTIAGLYAGMEYGTARVRGRRDWKNALIGGFLTGAVVSLADNNNRDKTIKNAITGGAIATAS
ncbi:hypothetical protein KI387_014105, partial [Taxus chinensis]